jgi:hypothetical protein
VDELIACETDADCCGGTCMDGTCCPAGSVCTDSEGVPFCCGAALNCDPASGVCLPIEALNRDRPVRTPTAN